MEREGEHGGSNPAFQHEDGINIHLKCAIERVLRLILNTLPPGDLLNYTENIKLCVKTGHDFRQFLVGISSVIQEVWDKIEDNLAETNNLGDIKDQCDIIEKFIRLIKDIHKRNVNYMFYTGENKRSETISKVYDRIETKLSREHLTGEGRKRHECKNDTDALAYGFDALQCAVESTERIKELNRGKDDPCKDPRKDFLLDFLWRITKRPGDLTKRLNSMDIYLAYLKKQSPENKLTKEKTVAEDRQISTFSNDPLEDGIKLLRIAVGRVSEISRNTLSPEELLGYCQKIKQSRQAVRSRTETSFMKNDCKSEFDRMAKDVVDRLWNTMRDREAINEMWKTVESKQKELAAEGNQENENHTAHADDIDTLGDAVDSISKLTNTLPCQFLFNFWDIIQGNISQQKDLSVIRN